MENFTKITLEPDERIDILPNGRKIIQSNNCFSYGIDSVLLSYFAKVKKGGMCLDLGTGNGVVPLLMGSRFPNNIFHGVELQKKSFSMAEKSVLENNLESSIQIFNADIKNPWDLIKKNAYSTVTANPPYMLKETGSVSKLDEKAYARHEILSSLNDFCSCAYYALNDGGSFFMIHRGNRISDVFKSLSDNHFSVKNLLFIYPDEKTDATMFIVESVKGGKDSFCNVRKPLFVYDTNGLKTSDIVEIYRSFKSDYK